MHGCKRQRCEYRPDTKIQRCTCLGTVPLISRYYLPFGTRQLPSHMIHPYKKEFSILLTTLTRENASEEFNGPSVLIVTEGDRCADCNNKRKSKSYGQVAYIYWGRN